MSNLDRRIMRLNNSKDVIEVDKEGNVFYILKEDNHFDQEKFKVSTEEVTKTNEHDRYRYYREKSKFLERNNITLSEGILAADRKLKHQTKCVETLGATNEKLRSDLAQSFANIETYKYCNERLRDEWDHFHRHSFLGFVWYTKCK